MHPLGHGPPHIADRAPLDAQIVALLAVPALQLEPGPGGSPLTLPNAGGGTVVAG
jgi:hypothetical protein